MVQTFSFESIDGAIDLSGVSYVDTMVTVVKVFNFLQDFSSGFNPFKESDVCSIKSGLVKHEPILCRSVLFSTRLEFP